MDNSEKLAKSHPSRAKRFGNFLWQYLWPVHRHEHLKLIPILALFWLISLVYHLLRGIKIPLVVIREETGAQTVPFLKIGAVLPGAILLTFLFTKLANRYYREYVFYIMLIGFILYFALFTFVLYPNHELLELEIISTFLQQNVLTHKAFSGLIAIIKHWNFTLFYVISELWSATILSMLFWGFVNEITTVNEATRFYAIFSIAINSAGIVIGPLTSFIGDSSFMNMPLYDTESQWLFYQLITVLAAGVVILAIFYILNRRILHSQHAHISPHLIDKTANKLSLTECFSYLKKSRYLIYVTILVITYNITYNIFDVVWTEKARVMYNDKKALNALVNQIASYTGILAVGIGLFLTGNMIRKLGWKFTALITPIIWLITSILFLGGMLIEKFSAFAVILAFFGNPVNIILLLGSIQKTLGRSCKYTIFDATKEMTFIPLLKKDQRKSKAVVDGISSRLGKSLGSILLIVLLFLNNDSISAAIPYIAIMIITMIIFWLISVLKLSAMVKKKFAHPQHDTIDY